MPGYSQYIIDRTMKGIISIALITLVSPLMGQTPTINSVVPLSTYPTNKILITGSGFSSTASDLRVTFDQVNGSIVTSSDFSLEVTVPPQARLTNLEVTNLNSNLSAKAILKFVPFYSGTNFDPLKLAAPLSFAAPEEVFDVCSCDLDGDGKPDLAATRQGVSTDIMIQRNTSTPGSLSFVSSTLATASPMTNLACGDLNGDGKPELVASRGGGTRNEVFIYRNTSSVGTISFAAVTKLFLDAGHFAFRMVIRDLNQDGNPEVIVSDSFSSATGLVYVYANQSSGGTLTMNGTPIKISVTGTSTTYGLDAQDLDGDSKPEILVNQFNSNNVFIIKNTSSLSAVSFGAIQTINVTGTLNHMATADFNEDGKLDIAATSAFNNNVILLLNTTSGSTISFAAPTTIPTGDGPFGMDVSDIDGDGDVDIIVGNIDLNPAPANTEVTVLRSNGNNASLLFTTLNIDVGKKSRNVRVGDLDGDGKPDIAFTTVNSNSLDILRSTNCFVPQITNQAPLTICAGQTIRLNSIPGIGVTIYDWKESGSTVSSGTNAFLDITTAGNYTVTATSESGACVTTSSALNVTGGTGSVPTGNPPTTVSSNSPVCTGNPINLTTPFVAGVTYDWTGPNGFTSTQQNPTIASAAAIHAGVYTLQLVDGSCRSTPVTTQVEVADLQSFTVSSSIPSNTFCTGSNLTLSVESRPSHTYQWIKDGVDIGGQTATTLLVTVAGSYKVRVTNTLLSCSLETSAVAVTTVTMPVSSFTVNSTACVGETLTFTNTSTVDGSATAVFAWNFGDAGTSSAQNPTHAYASANNFSATLTVSYSGIPGCSNASNKNINVIATVLPDIVANPTTSCPGESVTLSITGTFNVMNWSTGSSGASIVVTQPGDYSINTVDTNGCPGTDQITVASNPVPDVVVTADKTLLAPGESAQLTATGADTYQWSPPESLSDPAIANPVATPGITTTYTVTGTFTGGCSADETIEIIVDAAAIAINVPNAFSPNGDGINDLWVITGVELYPDCTLSVFDKDGKKVLEQRGYTNNWDGTYNGRAVPEGNYFFVFGCTDKTPVSGTVLVAR